MLKYTGEYEPVLNADGTPKLTKLGKPIMRAIVEDLGPSVGRTPKISNFRKKAVDYMSRPGYVPKKYQ